LLLEEFSAINPRTLVDMELTAIDGIGYGHPEIRTTVKNYSRVELKLRLELGKSGGEGVKAW
jgi:hypothetical protein